MNNYLDSGAVLPNGLLGGSTDDMEGFNKTYNNTPLRVGVIVAVYQTDHKKNITKLVPEYDVVAIEQNADKGSTTITYRNCISGSSLGSIADYFEKTLRVRKKKKYKSESTRLNEQNGSVVFLLCLDGSSEKAIIIGGFPHPDRKTTLVDEGPRLEGEFNGINIKVEKDGSTTLTFKGATDNDGNLIDKTQGPTEMKIEKDGSYQVDHKTIKQRLDKNGKASLTADDDISNTTKKNFNVTAGENVNVAATKDVNIQMNNLLAQAQGSATIECEQLEVNAQSQIKMSGSEFRVEAASIAKIKGTQITLDGLVSLGGEGGQPVLLLGTLFLGIGNLGIPVLSTAIAGFATRVNGQ